MSDIFLKIVNMSISAGWTVLALLILRPIFKRAGKRLLAFLWVLPALRLVLPFSFKSTLSINPGINTLPEGILLSPAPQINTGIAAVNNAVNPIISSSLAPEAGASVNPAQIIAAVLAAVWLAGAVCMVIYGAVSAIMLRRRLGEAVNVAERVYICDGIGTPFVFGFFRPSIYLPSDTCLGDSEYVLRHEMTHIKRLDHIFRPLGYLLLCFYWFNPLMWLAYYLYCGDTELACDEGVLAALDPEQRREYGHALVNCSTKGRTVRACPIAFGETGVKERVKTAASFKKPSVVLLCVAVILAVIIGVRFLTDPPQKAPSLMVNGGTLENGDRFFYATVKSADPVLKVVADAGTFEAQFDVIEVDRTLESGKVVSGFESGDRIYVQYDGRIAEIYPVRIIRPAAVRKLYPAELNAPVSLDVTLAWAGYCEAKDIYINADNKERAQKDDHLPVYVIKNEEDLGYLHGALKHDIIFDQGYGEVQSIDQATANCNSEFFEEKMLLCIYVRASSGSYRYGIGSVTFGEELIAKVVRVNDPTELTNDMAGWMLILTLDRADTEGITVFDAVLTDAEGDAAN